MTSSGGVKGRVVQLCVPHSATVGTLVMSGGSGACHVFLSLGTADVIFIAAMYQT